MKPKTIKGNSQDQIQSALNESLVDGFKPTLAIVFVSIKQDHVAICKPLDDLGIRIFGATTNGEFIDNTTEKESVAIMLLDMNPAYFTILFEEFPDKNYRERGSCTWCS